MEMHRRVVSLSYLPLSTSLPEMLLSNLGLSSEALGPVLRLVRVFRDEGKAHYMVLTVSGSLLPI